MESIKGIKNYSGDSILQSFPMKIGDFRLKIYLKFPECKIAESMGSNNILTVIDPEDIVRIQGEEIPKACSRTTFAVYSQVIKTRKIEIEGDFHVFERGTVKGSNIKIWEV